MPTLYFGGQVDTTVTIFSTLPCFLHFLCGSYSTITVVLFIYLTLICYALMVMLRIDMSILHTHILHIRTTGHMVTLYIDTSILYFYTVVQRFPKRALCSPLPWHPLAMSSFLSYFRKQLEQMRLIRVLQELGRHRSTWMTHEAHSLTSHRLLM